MSDTYTELKGLLQNGTNEIAKALNLLDSQNPEDVRTLKAQNTQLRGRLRYVYEQAQELQGALDPMNNHEKPFTVDQSNYVEEVWRRINSVTVNHAADTQTIIGHTERPISDLYE